jgi:hypothetical protein
MKRLLLYVAIAFLFTSCGLERHTTSNNGYLPIHVFQTLNNSKYFSECLARNLNFDYFYIISLDCPSKTKHEIYYDGKNIGGLYVLVGTYTYETKGGSMKTVQACMRKENYNDLYNYDKIFLSNILDDILTYNLIK